MTAHHCRVRLDGYDWGVYLRDGRAYIEANAGEYEQEVIFCPYCGAKLAAGDTLSDPLDVAIRARKTPDSDRSG